MTPTPSHASDVTALLAEKDARIADCEAEIRSQALLIEKLKHQIAGHARHRFGARSETLDQLNLRLEEAEIADAATRPLVAPAEPEVKEQPKRRPLPDHLARNETVLEIGDACSTCGGKLRRLGEDVTEELEFVPGRFVVNRIVRPRMTCACCDKIVQAPLPSRPIEKGRPGPGLLANVLLSKYGDHCPLL